MRIMLELSLILHMRDRDRDPPRLLLRRLINLLKLRKRFFRFRSANTFVIAAVNVVFP